MFQVAKAVSHSLNNCVNCLPGQKDVDMALRSIGEASKKLLVDTVSPTASWPLTLTLTHPEHSLLSEALNPAWRY